MTIFKIYRQDRQFVIKILGLTIKFKNMFIDSVGDLCCIGNIEYIKKQNTHFPHPIGVVISKNAKIGKNCIIYQNVTIGDYVREQNKKNYSPVIGDNVVIYAGAIIIGNVLIGDNAKIGAGSVVVKDVPANATVVGNPAHIVKIQ